MLTPSILYDEVKTEGVRAVLWLSALLSIIILLVAAPSLTAADTTIAAARAAFNRGLAHDNAGRVDEAVKEYTEAIRLDANYMAAYRNRGFAYARAANYELAIKDYSEVIRLKPTGETWEAYQNRGILYGRTGRYQLAVEDFDNAIRLKPTATAHNGRGNAYRFLGLYEQALESFAQALRLDPRFVSAYNNQAWLLATAQDARYRDGKKATELALRACELSNWKRADYIDTLAAAHAEAGNFAEAVQHQEKALTIGRLTEAQGEKARARLELYRQGKPYRE
jgi:tetratricopeptide (TPR) repeat protein